MALRSVRTSDPTSPLDDAPTTVGPTAAAKPGAGRLEPATDRPEAEADGRETAKPVHPLLVLRRLRKLGKEARELQVRITGEVPPRWRGPTLNGPATGEGLERLRTAVDENRRKTACCHRMLDEAGYMPTSQLVLRRGDRVLTSRGHGTVWNPRAQMVEIRFDQPVRWVGGPQHTLRFPYGRVWVPRETVEQRSESESTPQAGALGKGSAAAPGSRRTPLATLIAQHRDPTRYTVKQIIDALVEAERLGVGSKLAQYFRAKLRAQDVERAYGRAQEIVAFERGGRPPSAPGGQTYGEEDLGGVVEGVEHEPVVAERLSESRTWAERMNAVTGHRVLPWLPENTQDVIRFIQGYRARGASRAARGEEPTRTHGSGDERSAPSTAASRAAGACEVEGSSLNDPMPDSEAVDPTLAEHGSRDEGSRDSLPVGDEEEVSILAMIREAIEAAGQTLGEADEEALAERDGMGEPALDGREDDPALVQDEGSSASTTTCSAGLVGPAPASAPATATAAVPRPRTPYSAIAPRRARRAAWARVSVAASPAVAWCPRPARSPGSRSTRGPPGVPPVLFERGPRDGGPPSSTLPQQPGPAGPPPRSRRRPTRARAHAVDPRL